MRCREPLSLAGAAKPSAASPGGRRPAVLATAAACLTIAAGAAFYVGNRPAVARAAASSHPEASRASRPASPVAAPVTRAPGPQDLGRSAVAAYRDGDVPASIEQLTAAVQGNPADAEALNNLGQVLVRADRASEAIPYFDRAIEQSPRVWAYHFNRARAYAVLQSWSTAIDGYRDAAGLFPSDYATQFNLARALQANGDLPAAIEAYGKAVALAPGEPDFLLSLAAAQEAASRRADAAQSYKRYLELEPNTPEADKIKDRIARLTT